MDNRGLTIRRHFTLQLTPSNTDHRCRCFNGGVATRFEVGQIAARISKRSLQYGRFKNGLVGIGIIDIFIENQSSTLTQLEDRIILEGHLDQTTRSRLDDIFLQD